jgi:hypothetical protein
MTKTKKSQTLPQQIYVVYDADENFLDASATPAGIDDGAQVGIYELKDLRKMKITKELV